MEEKMEQCLQSFGVSRRCVGYKYLTTAALLVGKGSEIGPDLLAQVGHFHGRNYYQVRMGIQRVLGYLPGETRGRGMWESLQNLFQLVRDVPLS